MCIDQCNFNDRMELAWLRLGKWRLRCERRDAEKGRCPLCNAVENVAYMLLKCDEAKRRREQFSDNKWLYINEETARKIIISRKNITEFKKKGVFLYKVKDKWENEVTKTVQVLDEMKKEQYLVYMLT